MNLAAEYQNVLSSKLDGQCAVYDYAADFADFWEYDETRPAPKIIDAASESASKAIIIVWGGMPDDKTASDKLLMPHLTPLDWVLAFSMKMLSLDTVPLEDLDFSIHIIDLTVKAYEDSYASSVRGALLDEMPWVRLYAPLMPPNARYRKRHFPLADLILSKDLKAELDKVPKMACSLKGHESEAGTALSNISQLWRASVIQRGDHHDLNNIVAPILIPNLFDSNVDTKVEITDAQDAFIRRLLWCALLPESCKEEDPYKPPEFSTPLDIVAIDDQLADGWDDVLGLLVGIPEGNKATDDGTIGLIRENGELKVYGATKPMWLLDHLGISVTTGNEVDVKAELYSKRTFDTPGLPKSTDGATRPWMLVLDIRLFSGQVTTERKWYTKLAGAALKLMDHNDKFAWQPGFYESERNQLEFLAQGGSADDSRIDTALSLLPRLCSLRWPSVPIIVFSGTGRRGLISKLAEYGNIFLSSPKPNVLGDSPVEQVAAFTEGWKREFQSVRSLINVQNHFLSLMKSSEPIYQLNENWKTGHLHVICAFDEVGDFTTWKSSAVGGVILFAFGGNEETAIENAMSFQESLRMRGVNFYNKPPYYTDAKKNGVINVNNILYKKDDISSALAEVRTTYQETIQLSVFRYRIPKSGYSDKSTYRDSAYIRGLTHCLELIFSDFLPSVGISVEGQKTTFSLWFPSKQASFYNENEIKVICDRACKSGKSPTEVRNKENEEKNRQKPAAIIRARTEALRLDFRHQAIASPLVETIGGYGVAYSVILSALGLRPVLNTVIGAIRSLKARKIPYSLKNKQDKSDPAIHWFCPECKEVFQNSTCGKLTHTLQLADYSVMSHVADAALHAHKFPNDEVGENAFEKKLCFDVIEDEVLTDFIHVSRLLDERQDTDGIKIAIDGIKIAYKHGFFCDWSCNSNAFAKARIHRRLVSQLRELSYSVTGTTLTELSGIRTRGITAFKDSKSKGKKPANSQPVPVPAVQALARNPPKKNGGQGRPKTTVLAYINGFNDPDLCVKLVKAALVEAKINTRIEKMTKNNPHTGNNKIRVQFTITPGQNQLAENALKKIEEFHNENWRLNFSQ
jgi:hypothetical protein